MKFNTKELQASLKLIDASMGKSAILPITNFIGLINEGTEYLEIQASGDGCSSFTYLPCVQKDINTFAVYVEGKQFISLISTIKDEETKIEVTKEKNAVKVTFGKNKYSFPIYTYENPIPATVGLNTDMAALPIIELQHALKVCGGVKDEASSDVLETVLYGDELILSNFQRKSGTIFNKGFFPKKLCLTPTLIRIIQTVPPTENLTIRIIGEGILLSTAHFWSKHAINTAVNKYPIDQILKIKQEVRPVACKINVKELKEALRRFKILLPTLNPDQQHCTFALNNEGLTISMAALGEETISVKDVTQEGKITLSLIVLFGLLNEETEVTLSWNEGTALIDYGSYSSVLASIKVQE
jgi:hypothetical protein